MNQNIPLDVSKISDEELDMLTNNLDVIYVYLDLYIDNMSDEEVSSWESILDIIEKTIDKNNYTV